LPLSRQYSAVCASTSSSQRFFASASSNNNDDYWSSWRRSSSNSTTATKGRATLQQWSLDSLTAIPNENSHTWLQDLVTDVALRLDRQNAILVKLEQILHDESRTSTESHLLDSAHKTLRNLKHMHKDTHNKCSLLLPAMQKQQYGFNTLMFQHAYKTLEETHTRHALTMESLAEMVVHVRPLLHNTDSWNSTIMTYLQSKIGLQLLADHGSRLAKEEISTKQNHNPNKLGMISVDVLVSDVIEQARTEAKHLCEAHYLTSPPVISLNQTTTTTTVTCVRPWLQFTLVELLKNSMAITAQRKFTSTNGVLEPMHYNADEEEEEFQLNPIFIQVEETPTHVEIQIIDQGEGTSQDPLELFHFCQTQKVWDRMDDQQTYAMTRSPMQGLGVGLCMSRLHMQHFGGNLELKNHQPTALLENEAVSSELRKGMTAKLTIPKNTSMLERTLDD
jgi:signal transduction histidine kinase